MLGKQIVIRILARAKVGTIITSAHPKIVRPIVVVASRLLSKQLRVIYHTDAPSIITKQAITGAVAVERIDLVALLAP